MPACQKLRFFHFLISKFLIMAYRSRSRRRGGRRSSKRIPSYLIQRGGIRL